MHRKKEQLYHYLEKRMLKYGIRGKRRGWKKMEKKGCKKDKVGGRKEKRVKKRISGEPMLEKIRYRSNEKANCW